jgi:alanine dehydrogenase
MSLLLNRATIQGLVTMEDVVNILEAAFTELVSGTSVMPQRIAETDAEHNGWYAFMPAQLKKMGALGIKAVTVYKDNTTKHDLPVTLATIILMDSETGQTISVMDGGYLTAMRTGAVSGLATRYLARSNAGVMGVLGTGVQGRAQLWGMSVGHKFDSALCFSMDTLENQKKFAVEVSEHTGVPTTVVSSTRELVESVDVLALATTATSPVIDGDWLKPGLHINAIGSHAPGVRELDTKTVVKSKIICDQTTACLAEAGDIQIPIQEGALKPEDIYGEMGEVITRQKKGRESEDDITLFKSVGLSVQDISTAHYVYQRAREQGVGTEFQF